MARLRAVVVVAVVLVLGAWTCQVPTDSPGSAGSADVPISTTGLTALVAGEDWHYVGESSEPAFNTGWSNLGSPYPALAFRYREPGIVDLVGAIQTNGTGTEVFTLPEGYRPGGSRYAFMDMIRDRSSTRTGRLLVVQNDGKVYLGDVDTNGDLAFISGLFYTDNATAP